MGCAPTNRKRTTTPAKQAKPSQSSIVMDNSPSGMKKQPEQKENVISIENFDQLPSKNAASTSQLKSLTKVPARKNKTRIDPINDDIIIKDERRGFAIERMDFLRKEHLQG